MNGAGKLAPFLEVYNECFKNIVYRCGYIYRRSCTFESNALGGYFQCITRNLNLCGRSNGRYLVS
jgi:hypothetical protein